MTFNDIVAAARSRAGDVDSAAYRYTDNEYAVILRDLARTYGVRGVLVMGNLVVTTTPGSEDITPEPTNDQGVILATAAALRLLQQTYRKRVDDGSLGVSWQSGLEQESTISARQAYAQMVSDVEQELQELLLLVNQRTFASRVQ